MKQRDTKNQLECCQMPVVPWQLHCLVVLSLLQLNIEKVFKQTAAKKSCGEYQVYTAKERAEIGKRAAVYGITSIIRYYRKNNLIFPQVVCLT